MGYTYRKYPEEFCCRPDGKISRLYRTWYDMHKRCRATAEPRQRKSYYDKGIRVCEEWFYWPTFAAWARSHGYTDDLEIDRVNTSKGYSPDNCRWLTSKDQNRHAHARAFLCVETRCVFFTHSEAAEKTGVKRQQITAALSGARKTAGGFNWQYLKIQQEDATKVA